MVLSPGAVCCAIRACWGRHRSSCRRRLGPAHGAGTVPIKMMDEFSVREARLVLMNRDGACTATAGCGPTGGRAFVG